MGKTQFISPKVNRQTTTFPPSGRPVYVDGGGIWISIAATVKHVSLSSILPQQKHTQDKQIDRYDDDVDDDGVIVEERSSQEKGTNKKQTRWQKKGSVRCNSGEEADIKFNK